MVNIKNWTAASFLRILTTPADPKPYQENLLYGTGLQLSWPKKCNYSFFVLQIQLFVNPSVIANQNYYLIGTLDSLSQYSVGQQVTKCERTGNFSNPLNSFDFFLCDFLTFQNFQAQPTNLDIKMRLLNPYDRKHLLSNYNDVPLVSPITIKEQQGKSSWSNFSEVFLLIFRYRVSWALICLLRPL